MRSVSLLYQGESSLHKLIEEKTILPETPCLIRIYTADATRQQAADIAGRLQQLFPKAQIVGCSASGIIYNGQQYADHTLILFDDYEKTEIVTRVFSWHNQSAWDVGRQAAEFASAHQLQLMHVLCSDYYYDVHAFVEAFNHFNQTTKLVGGIAGDILPHNIASYVFTGEGIQEQAIVAAGLSGDSLYTYNEVNISHEPVSEKYTLTGCEGPYWDTVDGIPAETWLREQLGIERTDSYASWQEIADNDMIVRFPMILEHHHGASRMLKYDGAAHRISQYFSQIPVNTEFRIGYTSPAACIQRCYEICSTIGSFPIENLFVYSCLFRRLYMHNCAEWELSPFHGYPVCGAFILGEISNVDGVNEFLNGACCLVGTAENQVYLRTDSDVFENLKMMEDDTQKLLNYVLRKQRESVNLKNEALMNELLKKQQKVRENLTLDVHTGLSNYIQYKEDLKTSRFDKLIMIRIENAESLKMQRGQDRYFKILRLTAQHIRSYLQTLPSAEAFACYILNDETLFLAVNDQLSEALFMNEVHALLEKFQFIRIEQSDEIVLCRFVAVLHQQDMVERALNTLHASRSRQTSLLICSHAAEEVLTSSEEFKIIGVLNRALEHDGVIPYFQGIVDNESGTISKYEALMRIIDIDGTVYAPDFFMDTAKKYHLYSYLSESMYQKVFTLFAGRQESVSLNFSAYDINSAEMQRLIFDQIRKIKNPSNFVLEILEDEPFKDMQTLKAFIDQVRAQGIKIAIDDFGSGYSNFLQLAEIRPDFLKVDGEIIRRIHCSETHRKLLRTIVYMGQEFGMQIVAEYVENDSIQKYILKNKVRYSQGFYFSRPQNFQQLMLTEGNLSRSSS